MYSPANISFFQIEKKGLAGKRNDEVIAETSLYFEVLEHSYFLEGRQEIERLWTT